MIKTKTLTDNVYYVAQNITSKNLCNYLILIENDGLISEIIPVDTIQKVLDICTFEKKLCRVFVKNGTLGKNWRYLCDISKGVI